MSADGVALILGNAKIYLGFFERRVGDFEIVVTLGFFW